MQTVLVTGGAGYIGSCVVRCLLEEGIAVRALDILRSGDHGVAQLRDHPRFELRVGDVTNAQTVERAVAGVEGVIHLAAIVGDPACAREPQLARATNEDGSRLLLECAERAGVRRFVFASTCSNYGRMEGSEAVDETSTLRPVSLYAETKVRFEEHLRAHRGPMERACLRFATAYGLSPRMRFDLTVNEFTRAAALGEELVVFGEQFWRPYCHVEDLARAARLALLTAPERLSAGVFNVGDDGENYRKGQVVEAIQRAFPGLVVQRVAKQEDPRDYRVSFRRIREVLGFRNTRTVPDGIAEMRAAIEAGMFDLAQDRIYSNV